MKRSLPIVILILGIAGCGGGGDAEEKPAKQNPELKLATKAGLERCLERAGVDFDPGGSVPADPTRKQWPRGWDPPAGGQPAGATYAGAASFDQGGLVDVWIVESVDRAETLVLGFAPDLVDLSDPATRHADEWFWDHNRNLLLAVSDDPTPDSDDPSSGRFDRCLQRAG